MRPLTLSFLTSCLLLSLSFGDEPNWGYRGKNSPENWGKIAKEFSTCATGKNQSPIKITDYLEVKNPKKATFHYEKSIAGKTIKSEIDNGHTIQVNFNPGNYIELDNDRYELVQLHFHSPAEFQIDGKQYPLAMHLVHQDKKGQILVVGIEFKFGKENKILDPIWETMPQKVGETTYPKVIDLKALMPQKINYYYFNGSLTTPPCTEGVTWIVVKEPLEVSKSQVEKFQKVMGGPNNRPIQPSNNRVIIEQ